MDPELAALAALAARHALDEHVLRDLVDLWSRRDRATLAVVDGHSAVTLHLEDEEPAPPPPAVGDEALLAGRYEDLGLIDAGGMGEVRRVRDVALNRVLAMKLVHGRMVGRPASLARFLEEAQATAQLQHPHIVPVHDIGTLPDGRLWFTMRVVEGRTLSDIIEEVHAASTDRWQPTASGWSFRRLMSSFHAVCQAVAFAHERGVIHRDLKPNNIMVGTHGEVYVLDWGLAKILGRPDLAAEAGALEAIRTDRWASGDHRTQLGQVAGTPAYMPPEQARGEVDRLDRRSDVYALGAILYEVLSGRPPYQGPPQLVLEQVRRTAPAPLREPTTPTLDLDAQRSSVSPEPPLPLELVSACRRAMARDPAARFPSATSLADEVQAWLDGARRREQALEVVGRALSGEQVFDALSEQAARLRAEGSALLGALNHWQPEEDKLEAWAKQDEADEIERAAMLTRLRIDRGLHGALQIAPDLPEAHAALVARYQRRHADVEAELLSDATTSSRAALLGAEEEARALLTAHVSALHDDHPTRREATAYLRGIGALTLITDPDGAEVELLRYEPHGRRLVARHVRALGRTPLVEVPIEMGRYLCVIRHPDRAEVRYPVHIGRGFHWDGVPPDGSEPAPVPLPRRDELGPDDCYVPPGWSRLGSDLFGCAHPPCMRWCDGFVIRRHPVTNREYMAYLHDLLDQGREEEALRNAPRERSGTADALGDLIYGRDADGRFHLRPDHEGDEWTPDFPVIMVSWHCATAYAAWLGAHTGRPWRLPWELEWEKAARGVDGRRRPWGDGFDASYTNMRASTSGRPLPRAVDAMPPQDESVYGVRGLAGNVQDWCLDAWTEHPPPKTHLVRPRLPDPGADLRHAPRVVRGGFYYGDSGYSMSSFRMGSESFTRYANIGFRVARPWPS